MKLAVAFILPISRPKGATSHHSISLTVLLELASVETYRSETPPIVREPIFDWYREVAVELEEADVAVEVAEVLVGGGARARAKTG